MLFTVHSIQNTTVTVKTCITAYRAFSQSECYIKPDEWKFIFTVLKSLTDDSLFRILMNNEFQLPLGDKVVVTVDYSK